MGNTDNLEALLLSHPYFFKRIPKGKNIPQGRIFNSYIFEMKRKF